MTVINTPGPKQVRQLEKLWMVYGNRGPQHDDNSHKYIQRILDSDENDPNRWRPFPIVEDMVSLILNDEFPGYDFSLDLYYGENQYHKFWRSEKGGVILLTALEPIDVWGVYLNFRWMHDDLMLNGNKSAEDAVANLKLSTCLVKCHLNPDFKWVYPNGFKLFSGRSGAVKWCYQDQVLELREAKDG